MKNNKLYIILFALGTSAFFSACSDYLSEVPDNRTQINSEEKIQELLVGAYPVNAYAPFLEPMSDNFGDKGNLSETTTKAINAYSWEQVFLDSGDTSVNYWSACYNAIAAANQALESIEKLGGAENEELNEERGEALLARAYAHFMLVNIFAQHYAPKTAATDLGIPYVLEPETEAIKTYKRNSVQEVYDLIEKDITEGLALLGNDYTQPKFHFTPEAGMAFATRFYLYKGDWDKVIDLSSQLLGGSGENLRDWAYYVNNLQLAEIGDIVMSPREPSNLLIAVPYTNLYQSFAFNRIGLTEDIKTELFDGSNPYGKDWAYQVVYYSTGGLTYTINKYDFIFEYTDITAGIGYRRSSIALLTFDETLLARAEAYAMKNNFAGALKDINTFLSRKTRGYNPTTDVLAKSDVLAMFPDASEYQPFYELTPEQSSFVKMIAELRRREFYMEGLRWFDIKRFHIPVTHDFADGQSMTLKANDLRRAVQIPQSATSFGVEPNPR